MLRKKLEGTVTPAHIRMAAYVCCHKMECVSEIHPLSICEKCFLEVAGLRCFKGNITHVLSVHVGKGSLSIAKMSLTFS